MVDWTKVQPLPAGERRKLTPEDQARLEAYLRKIFDFYGYSEETVERIRQGIFAIEAKLQRQWDEIEARGKV